MVSLATFASIVLGANYFTIVLLNNKTYNELHQGQPIIS